MKNILFIIFTFVSFACSAQWVQVFDSIDASSFATDTALIRTYYSERGNSIEFDYSDLSVDDVVLDLGVSNYPNTFNRVTTAQPSFPFTLDVTGNSYTSPIDGSTKASLIVQGDKWKGYYLTIIFIKTTPIASEEFIRWKIVK